MWTGGYKVPTQQEVAKHLDLSQKQVSEFCRDHEIDWKTQSLDAIRVAYIRHLRGIAAGHKSESGEDIVQTRNEREKIGLQIDQLNLAERLGQLVNLDQLKPDLANSFHHIKTTLLNAADKVKPHIDALYGIDFDVHILHAEHERALAELARYTGDEPAPH